MVKSNPYFLHTIKASPRESKLVEAKYPNDKGITGEEKKQTDSAIKETFPFGYTLSLEYDSISTSINKLVPSLSASNEIAVSWGLLGVGLGFGEEEYIGFRYLSGSGKTDSFYYSKGIYVILMVIMFCTEMTSL